MIEILYSWKISARPHLRAILNDDQACSYEKMLAFRELTELSLDEKSTVDPFEYLPPSGDISTAEIYKMLMGLILTCLKSTDSRRYMGAMHKLDSLLYQYLHDGIKHIVVDELETQPELGNFQKSEAQLRQLAELSRSIFGEIDNLVDVPLFAPNLVRLEQYAGQTELPIEDKVSLTAVYARKLARNANSYESSSGNDTCAISIRSSTR